MLGEIIGGLISKSGQKSANAANLKIAREQMAFQEKMSNTAYQRSSKDLEAAGLNRILALGSPASSPQGASATMQNENAQLGAGVAKGANSAVALASGIAQIKNINAATAKTKAETINTVQQGQIKEPLADIMDFISDGTKMSKNWLKENVNVENFSKIADKASYSANQIMNDLMSIDIMKGAKLDPPKPMGNKQERKYRKQGKSK